MNDRISSIRKKRILFSPLNWGWGHVTRSFPLIHRLINQENELLICCNAEQEKFYRSEFPNLWYVPHEGYPFHFSGKGNWEKDLSEIDYNNLKTEIYNSEGKIIKEMNFQNEKLVKLELSELPSGLYNLRLLIDNESAINKKIVKK